MLNSTFFSIGIKRLFINIYVFNWHKNYNEYGYNNNNNLMHFNISKHTHTIIYRWYDAL